MRTRFLPGVPLPVFRPAIIIAVPFLLGIVAADGADAAPGPLALACWGELSLLALAAFQRKRGAARLALAGASFLAGAARMAGRLELLPVDVARQVAPDATVELTAIVATPVVPWPQPPWHDVPASGLDSARASFEADVEAIAGPSPRLASGRIRVSSYIVLPGFSIGDRITLRGALHPLREARNPGQPDTARRQRRRGVQRMIAVTAPSQIQVLAGSEGRPVWRAIEDIRGGLNHCLGADLRPDVAEFLGALLFGVQGNLSADVAAAFRRTGTLHYLAISGFHLMLIWGMLSRASASVGCTGPMSKGSILLVLAGYTLLTGLLASAVRSFLMIAAVMGADLIGRRRDALSSLCAAALAICVADPAQCFDVGFQLSFISVLGIVWLYPILRAMTSRPADSLQRLVAPRGTAAWGGAAARVLRDGVCVSMSAWMSTAPLVASVFHLMTPVINVANLALGPLVCLEIIGAIVKTASGAVGGWPDRLSAILLEWLYDGMVLAGRTLAALPGAWDPVAGMAWAGVVMVLTALVLWVRFCRVPRRRIHILWLAAAVALFGFSRTSPCPPEGLRIVALDVGQGSAHICETPEGGVVVYDAGSSSYADPGRSVVGPYLWARGITAVDLLILSHPDADHINGAASLLDGFRVGMVAVSPAFDRKEEGAWTARRATEEGARVVRLAAGDRVEGVPGAIIDVLGPPSGVNALRWSDNDASVLVRLGDVRGPAALFTGDVQKNGITELLASPAGDVAADVITLPHHGSKSSRSPALAADVRASFALVSARRGFASERTLEDYRQAGAIVLETWSEGAAAAERNGDGWRVMTFLGGWREPP